MFNLLYVSKDIETSYQSELVVPACERLDLACHQWFTSIRCLTHYLYLVEIIYLQVSGNSPVRTVNFWSWGDLTFIHLPWTCLYHRLLVLGFQGSLWDAKITFWGDNASYGHCLISERWMGFHNLECFERS